ncbi:hypothetical protein BDP67DRAFT_388644, partial [Colletotrichum lupini]
NIITVHKIYSEKANHHVIYEYMPRSLQEVVRNLYLNYQRLAVIIGQVVEALAHLEKMGLQHGRLSCSCVLLHPSGRVKLSNAWSHPLANAALIRMLGGQEDCRPLGRKKDLVDLGYTMMELMQGYVKEGANLGLDDPEQWDSDVVGFLSATTTASSAAEL